MTTEQSTVNPKAPDATKPPEADTRPKNAEATTPTTEAPEQPPTTPADDDAGTEHTPADAITEPPYDPAEEPVSHEAKRYRLRLRETEEALGELARQVSLLQRDKAEQIAAETISHPAGLWASGVQVSDLLDEDGNVAREKVTAATIEASERLGLTRKFSYPIVPGEGENPQPRGGGDDMEDVIGGW